jgi:hypothetical protein
MSVKTSVVSTVALLLLRIESSVTPGLSAGNRRAAWNDPV